MRRTFERSIHEREAKDSLTIKTNAAPQALGKQNDVPPPLADSNLSLPAVAAPVAPAEVVKAEIQKQQAEHAPVPATTEVKATPVAAAIAEVKAARRGRADKGHKRGEYKPRETNAAPQAVLAGSEAPQTASSHRPTAEPAVAAKDEP